MDLLFSDYFELIENAEGSEVGEIRLLQNNIENLPPTIKCEEWLQHLENASDLRSSLAAEHAKMKLYVAFVRSGSVLVEHLVYQLKSPNILKLYLSKVGQRLQRAGQFRNSIRLLEAACAIQTAHDEGHLNVCLLLSTAYRYTGQYRKCRELCEALGKFRCNGKDTGLCVTRTKPFPTCQREEDLSALGWERKLFGSNRSKMDSCQMQNQYLVAKRDFADGELIFIDKPLAGYVAESRGQCNYCTLKTLHTVPCTQCCAVFYCTVDCLRMDEHYHKYECHGFKLLFFPLTHGVLELRLLVKALDTLKRNLLRRPYSDAYPSTAEQLWEALIEDRKDSEDFRVIFGKYQWTNDDIQTEITKALIAKSSLLLSYIAYDGQLQDDYNLCWANVSETARDLFLASVLFRLSSRIKAFVCNFTYELAYDKAEFDEIVRSACYQTGLAGNMDESKNYPEKMDKFTAWNVEEIVEESASQSAAALPRTRDNLASFWTTCTVEANEQEISAERKVLRALEIFCARYNSTFHLIDHLKKNETASTPKMTNQYHGMYRFPIEMKISPYNGNTIGILLDHGAVAIRAIAPIKKGDILTIAYVDSGGQASDKPESASSDKTDLVEDQTDGPFSAWCDFPGRITVHVCKAFKAHLANMSGANYPYTYIEFCELHIALDFFITIYQKCTIDAECLPMLLDIIDGFEATYCEARKISAVLLQYEWMLEFFSLLTALRNAKKQIYEKLANI